MLGCDPVFVRMDGVALFGGIQLRIKFVVGDTAPLRSSILEDEGIKICSQAFWKKLSI